ncbi:MAG: hypothetical protein NTU63_03410 [Candidatus Pacearchaeota archaeon]|nr:hypothetical protein [Candidatus Pacearchaeota archaeon]
MALREDSEKVKLTGLERLSSVELIERFVKEIITHQNNLSKTSEEGGDYLTEHYMERTKSLREELAKRLKPRNPEVY